MDKIKRKEERIIFNKKVVAVYIFLGIIQIISDRTNILVAYSLISTRKTNPLQDLHLLYFKIPQQNFFANVLVS